MRALAPLLCLLSVQAWGACGSECWVDLAGTGSGAAAGTSVSDQCAGIADTDCTPAAGSTVHLCNVGTTITPQAVEGTAGGRITYTASCAGGTTGSLNATGQTYGVNITDREYLTFTGLDVDGPNNAGYLVNCTSGNASSNVRIEDADVTNVAGNGATIGNGFRWFCADVTLWNTGVDGAWSDAYYCTTCDRSAIDGDRANKRGWYAANFARGDAAGDGIQVVDGDDAIVANGTCEHSGDGTKLCVIQSSTSSTGGLVTDNRILNGVDGGISWVAPGGRIERNQIWNLTGGSGGSGAAIGIKLLGNNQRAVGNIVVDAKKCFYSDAANTAVEYDHNICLGFRDRGLDANTANAVTLTAKNNIFVGLSSLTSSNYFVFIGSGVTESIDYNDYFGGGSAQWRDTSTSYATLALWQAHGEDTNSVEVLPDWAGGTSPTDAAGFCLEPDSPLLGAGTYLGAWVTGYAGKDLGKPPAIGARGLCNARAAAAHRASATRQ
jgi:hypothetical protein